MKNLDLDWQPNWSKTYRSFSEAENDLVDFEFKGTGWYNNRGYTALVIEDLGLIRVFVWEYRNGLDLIKNISSLKEL